MNLYDLDDAWDVMEADGSEHSANPRRELLAKRQLTGRMKLAREARYARKPTAARQGGFHGRRRKCVLA